MFAFQAYVYIYMYIHLTSFPLVLWCLCCCFLRCRLTLAEGQKKAAEEKLREAEQERVGETERRPGKGTLLENPLPILGCPRKLVNG